MDLIKKFLIIVKTKASLKCISLYYFKGVNINFWKVLRIFYSFPLVFRGTYRKALLPPTGLTWSIKEYTNAEEPLVLDDITPTQQKVYMTAEEPLAPSKRGDSIESDDGLIIIGESDAEANATSVKIATNKDKMVVEEPEIKRKCFKSYYRWLWKFAKEQDTLTL